jgi:predicted Zn-dependent protease with MMP-like domain
MTFPQLLPRAERIVHHACSTLPADVRTLAEALPVIFEPTPGPELRAEGVDDDTLGLFVGPAHGEDPGLDPLPAQIIIYLNNIWDYAGGDTAVFGEEVRLTYLHELGHYLGWDEGDLEQRGLE